MGDGFAVGLVVGRNDGPYVGESVDGAMEGDAHPSTVGEAVGRYEGTDVGSNVGIDVDGAMVGDAHPCTVGESVGRYEGTDVVGAALGSGVGFKVGV